MTDLTIATRSQRLPAILAEALAFMVWPHARRPESLPLRKQQAALLALLMLNLGVLFLLLPLLILWTQAMGIELPRMMRDIPPLMVVVMAVLVLPPLEEIVFRGWMTGRPRALALLAGAVAIGLGLVAVHAARLAFLAPGIAIAGVVAALAAAWALRKREATPDWFTRNFKWFYWGSALIFASAHYSNYPAMSAAHLPVVLPQLWSGLVFGFVRLRFGLLQSITLHCTSNALVLVAFYLFGLPAA